MQSDQPPAARGLDCPDHDLIAELHRAALGHSFHEQPMPRLDSEAIDFRAASESFTVEWCKNTSDDSAAYEGKRWRYAPIPHDAIAENMTVAALAQNFGTA